MILKLKKERKVLYPEKNWIDVTPTHTEGWQNTGIDVSLNR
jgi:hypothetical protein